MRSFQDRLSDFEERGIHLVAISVDRPERSRTHATEMGWTFTVLSDPEAEVVRRYDLLHVDGGEEGNIARPAEFLIDPKGTVRWRKMTDNYWDRLRPGTVLRAFDELP